MNKKVLIIAYLFPPIGGGGVQRALKMAKYLKNYGCDVSVLTVENPRHVTFDNTLFNELSDSLPIYRAHERKIPGMGGGVTIVHEGGQQPKLTLKQKMIQKAKPFLRMLKETILVPDDQILWYREAVKL